MGSPGCGDSPQPGPPASSAAASKSVNVRFEAISGKGPSRTSALIDVFSLKVKCAIQGSPRPEWPTYLSGPRAGTPAMIDALLASSGCFFHAASVSVRRLLLGLALAAAYVVAARFG